MSNTSAYQKKLQEIARSISIPDVDSKYDMLTKVIDSAFSAEIDVSGKKILIFSVFRATIRYLAEKLQERYPDYSINTISGEDDIADIDDEGVSIRDKKRISFMKQEKPSILICSEVAGEGLDFQFCHYLVNYDMPWNPSRLEQRVGRLDRIGQTAEKITIVNLVNKRTIEDHVMSKLFERIKIFNSTIGPLGDLISKYQKEFTANILKPERTESEKKAYEAKILENLERKQKEQAKFEEQQLELVGVMDYFYDEAKKKKTFFLEREIAILWDYYLEKYVALKGIKFKVEQVNETSFSIRIDEDATIMLKELCEKGINRRTERRKYDHYLHVIDARKQRSQSIVYTFSHSIALSSLNVEHLNITHPFIMGAIKSLREFFHPNKQLVSIEVKTDKIQEGQYLVGLYQFSIINRMTYSREHTETRVYVYNYLQRTGMWQEESGLLETLFDTDRISDLPSMVDDNVDKTIKLINESRSAVAEEILDQYKKVYEYRMSAQKLSLQNYYQKRIQSEKDTKKHTHEPDSRRQINERIEHLETELEDKLQEITRAEFIVDVKCKGMLQVLNKGIAND